MAREINLVPDIKNEMIKTLKLRNFIFFLCIVVSVVSIVVALIFGLIMGGQQAAVDGKKGTIEKLSSKLNSYSDLNEFLTIKNQLSGIGDLTSNKKVLSRTFNILSALIPTGADKITISKLDIDLSSETPTFSIDAQADAGKEPFIDYNVLDSFKKSMKYMSYDYGNYVDKNGNEIYSYCMIETGEDGSTFRDAERGLYALWTINEEGCKKDDVKTSDYNTESYGDKTVVRIWRTPQFSDWYKEKEPTSGPYMSLDGQISGVEHFESACITYTGDTSSNSASPKWSESNESCLLVPDGDEGITISESSNGRVNDTLVLHFLAQINLAPEVFDFNNHHMLALAPVGRRNVTDSYIQIQSIFGERAQECASDDVDCANNTKNEKGENK